MPTATQTQPINSDSDIERQIVKVVEVVKENIVETLRKNGRYATGTTESQLEITSKRNHATLSAPGWIYALQDGRKPTSPGAATGDPTLFEQIKVWCEVKGIPQAAAWPITQKIHTEGYEGTPGLIDDQLSEDKLISIMDEILGDMAGLISTTVSNSINTVPV